MTPISVIILAKNEAGFIARCMSSVTWADEIVVVDSGSTDRTREIARDLGANVYEQPWLGWVPQRQSGIQRARNDWVMILESDEIITNSLRDSIITVMASRPDPRDGYVVDRRDECFGKLFPNQKRRKLRRGFVRLFNRQYSYYAPEDLIHERVICHGRRIPLPGILIHWRAFTLIDQLRRFLDNAGLEADMMQERSIRVGCLRLLAMPGLRFLWSFVYRGGWRLGTIGLVHAIMVAYAEFVRHAVLWERQQVAQCLHPPETIWRQPEKDS